MKSTVIIIIGTTHNWDTLQAISINWYIIKKIEKSLFINNYSYNYCFLDAFFPTDIWNNASKNIFYCLASKIFILISNNYPLCYCYCWLSLVKVVQTITLYNSGVFIDDNALHYAYERNTYLISNSNIIILEIIYRCLYKNHIFYNI